jgi:hypothetical protein
LRLEAFCGLREQAKKITLYSVARAGRHATCAVGGGNVVF